ncbi:MAG: nuclear transport factor 2 family protein [Bacteroidales bacterium]|nr:nuclear transport factor 2 family protein [Bacteroidales bacterium]
MEKLMRFSWMFVLISLIITTGCTTKVDPNVELQNAEKVLQSYFDGISAFDYQKMRDACSSDYLLFEDGIIWTVEDHINFLQPMEGMGSISYSFHDSRKTIDGNVAWITHRNIAEAIMQGNPVHFEWIESVILRKMDSGWKMVLLHSTTAKTAEPQ